MAITEKDITICGHGSGTPSLKNMNAYFTLRYNMVASNKRHKGIVKVMRLKAMTDDGRKKFREKYKTILGRNSYNQNLRNYVYSPYGGKYYSDCSSSGMATMKAIGYNVPLLNTAGIYQSGLFEEVPVKIVNGHITNPEILKVADCLLFVGSDPSRPLQIGHVEYVYEIAGKVTTTASKSTTTSTSKTTKPAVAKATLKKGSKGEQVKNLQKDLNYVLGTNVKVDGEFGAITESTLISFQKKYGLTKDGIYGEKSFSKMQSLLK